MQDNVFDFTAAAGGISYLKSLRRLNVNNIWCVSVKDVDEWIKCFPQLKEISALYTNVSELGNII